MSRIGIKSCEYPYLLKQIKDPPEKLYFRGDWNTDLFEETLSVVGSRRMTRYGETITNDLVGVIAEAGITIVSGFMYGIDAQSHAAALERGGRTIAVMPCGIEKIHPEYQADLHTKILRCGGLVVSEYPGDTLPARWTYPRRNRIIAGLSPALLVVEAGLKSGALITARIAMNYNKRVFAVPGPLTSSVSRGTALLIKQGASIMTSADDILSEYGKFTAGKPHSEKKSSGLNESQSKIVVLLSLEPLGIDEITRAVEKPTSEIGADLTILCLKKLVTLNEGKYYLVVGAGHAY